MRAATSWEHVHDKPARIIIRTMLRVICKDRAGRLQHVPHLHFRLFSRTEASSQAPKSLPITCTSCPALLSLLSHPPTHICSLSVQSQQGWLRCEQISCGFTWNCAHKANVSQRFGTNVRVDAQVAYSAQRQLVRQDPALASAAGFAGTAGTSST